MGSLVCVSISVQFLWRRRSCPGDRLAWRIPRLSLWPPLEPEACLMLTLTASSHYRTLAFPVGGTYIVVSLTSLVFSAPSFPALLVCR